MLFNTLQFGVFFLLVLWGGRAAPPTARLPLLLAASLTFYALWVPSYLLLLLGTILLNFALLRAMVTSSRPRPFLIAAIVSTLGSLGFFKYAAFLIESVSPVFSQAIGWAPPAVEFVLPLGISFYTFQILAVAIDTYRGHLAPIRSLSRYTLFVCFFPQLIAGPIVRGSELLPQLESGPAPSALRSRRGIWLVACGLVKKILFADYLLSPFVNGVFENSATSGTPYLIVAAYSFAFQIYFDFSGYSDIARGLALLLGFELPFNFKEPYLSRDPSEFWRRWHITLSSWLRDYLYFPLGGNRGGSGRTPFNLMVTMLLGGLWHGASWTFVAWGGLHGLLLVAHRSVVRHRRTEAAPLQWADGPRIVVLFHIVCVAWIFFRARSIEGSLSYLSHLVAGDFESGWPVFQMLVVAVCAALHPLERYARLNAVGWQRFAAESPWGPFVEGAAFGTVAAACFVASSGGEFIYFQF